MVEFPSESQVPLIKGTPATRIIKMLAEGHHYEQICRRYRLTYRDINHAVHFRNYVLVPERFAQGKASVEIAREFGFSRSNAWAIKRRIARDKELEKLWRGLSVRAVNAARKAIGCKNLQDLIDKSLTEEELRMTRGIGSILAREISGVLSLYSRG